MSTTIAWTNETWNPTTGCTRVSEGCRHCYIERTPPFRMKGRKFVNGSTGVLLHPDRLEAPLHWKKPRRIFVNSMSDLFHEDIPNAFLEDVWARMCIADHHTYQILTKRPQRMFDWLTGQDWDRVGMIVAKTSPMAAHRALARKRAGFKMFEHVWLGVSIEDQATADERIPLLLQTPAAVRWISAEPLLGPVDLLNDLRPPSTLPGRHVRLSPGEWIIDADGAHLMWRGLDWVVVGGESGPGARPCDINWIRSIKDQCRSAGVPPFVKQIGSKPVGWCAGIVHSGEPESSFEKDYCDFYEASEIAAPCKDGCMELHDKKGGDIREFPEDLRVREYPR